MGAPLRLPELAALAALALLGAATGCPRSDPAPSSGSAPTPTTIASTAAPPAPVAPGSRPAVRELTASGPAVEGLVLEVRALRRRVTTLDPVHLALRLRPEVAPPPGGAWSSESVDWAATRASLRFDVETASGRTHTLSLRDPGGAPVPWPVTRFQRVIGVDGAALAEDAARHPWSTPAPDLLATPGPIEVTISGTFAVGARRVPLRAGPIAITVVAAGPDAEPLVDLERAASEVARATWSSAGIPIPSSPTVEHDDGSVSVRFERTGLPGETGYDAELLEVWLDSAGRTLAVDAYRHFTCVAEGTLVATPAGEVPVEALQPGAEVEALDVATGARTTARVVRVERAYADVTLRLGGLRVTPEHPVWADGAWIRAGELRAGAALLGVEGVPLAAPAVERAAPATVVDVEVTAPHTFFAGGVLVHNKAQHVPLAGDRPWGALFYRRAARP